MDQSNNLDEHQMEDRRLEYLDKVKKYKQIENDMRAFNESLTQQFKKQQEEVSRLDMENYALLEQL